jgi:chromosome segregation ATPase
MRTLRRLIGTLVMIAGVIGLALSLAGLVGLMVVRPRIAASAESVLTTLSDSMNASQEAMVLTGDALVGAVDSVDALSSTLAATAESVKNTQPVITQVNTMMGEQLPATLEAATDSLATAGEAARSLESTIKSLDTFRAVMGAVPLLNAFVPADTQNYNPKKPLADSLGELSSSLEDMPASFEDMAANIDKADDNLTLIQTNLTVMADSVAVISTSLQEYERMVSQSETSMGALKTMLDSTRANLDRIMTITTLVLALFFFWLLATQAVIFSQGWELFVGTAGRM